MWSFRNAGYLSNVRFVRAAGLTLAVLALGAGAVSVIGITMAGNEPQIEMAEANALEQGAAAMFRAVDESVARQHELSLE
jgi:hypothetical protein